MKLKCLFGKHVVIDDLIYGRTGHYCTICQRCNKKIPVSDIKALVVMVIAQDKILRGF